MYPRPLQNLITRLSKLPSIGPRQAARLAFFLLNEPQETLSGLGEAIIDLKSKISACRLCFKTIEETGNGNVCKICSDKSRDRRVIAVVEKESDFAAIEKTKKYGGLYHILGGAISPLDAKGPDALRIKELFYRVKNSGADAPIEEVVLATNPTTEGDATALYIERVLKPLKVKISRLGRGLSVGAELEYADETTVASALQNRK